MVICTSQWCRSCKGKGYSVTAAAPVQVVQPTVVYQTQTPYGAASVNVVPAHNQQSVPLTAPTRNIMYWVAANAQRQQRWMTMGGDFFAAQRLWDMHTPAEQSRFMSEGYSKMGYNILQWAIANPQRRARWQSFGGDVVAAQKLWDMHTIPERDEFARQGYTNQVPILNVMNWAQANPQRHQRVQSFGGDAYAAQRLWDMHTQAEQDSFISQGYTKQARLHPLLPLYLLLLLPLRPLAYMHQLLPLLPLLDPTLQ